MEIANKSKQMKKLPKLSQDGVLPRPSINVYCSLMYKLRFYSKNKTFTLFKISNHSEDCTNLAKSNNIYQSVYPPLKNWIMTKFAEGCSLSRIQLKVTVERPCVPHDAPNLPRYCPDREKLRNFSLTAKAMTRLHNVEEVAVSMWIEQNEDSVLHKQKCLCNVSFYFKKYKYINFTINYKQNLQSIINNIYKYKNQTENLIKLIKLSKLIKIIKIKLNNIINIITFIN